MKLVRKKLIDLPSHYPIYALEYTFSGEKKKNAHLFIDKHEPF